MDITITPGKLRGSVPAIPSKSQAHRLLICAALGQKPARIQCPAVSQDILATAQCLRALGAEIERDFEGFTVVPGKAPETAVLDCGESGSTLRFLLPVAGALGVNAKFLLHGRLGQRPLSPLWEELSKNGCTLSREGTEAVCLQGQLRPGEYCLNGGVSSQFVSGLLFALPILPGDSRVKLLGKVESRAYIDMTRAAIESFGGEIREIENGFFIPGNQKLQASGPVAVEGDWSNGAFWLCAKSLGSSVSCTGLSENSLQGDRQAVALLAQIKARGGEIDAAQIPDLVPILAVAASAGGGIVRFVNAGRLRIKESDRLHTVASLILGLGGRAEEGADSLTVYPTGLIGGEVSAENDHRIAMSAAIASTVCREKLVLRGAEAVEKSYPHFWRDFAALGGKFTEGADT